MSYNLRVRFKNNVRKSRHMDPKKIARIELYFKLKIPASKAFLEYNKLYTEESVSKSTFFKYYKELRKGLPIYKRNFSPDRPARLMRNDFINWSFPIHLWPPGSWPRNWAALFLQLPSGAGRCTSSTSSLFGSPMTFPPRPQNDALKWRKPS